MSDKSERIKQANLRKEADLIIETLPRCARLYFRNIRIENKSERTIKQYAYDIKGFFEFVANTDKFSNKDLNKLSIGDILNELDKEDLQDYIDTIATYETNNEMRISSPSYISRKISSLKSFYKYYYDCGDIKHNPSTLLKNPKLKQKNILIMEKDEINRIIEAVKSEDGLSERELKFHKQTLQRDLAIMMLFLGTGIRVSELVGIDMSDLDFREASLKVVRKGGDEDEVFFSSSVQAQLETYINTERDILLDGKDEAALFISNKKTRMTDRSVEMLIKKYSMKAGLNKKITPHALRRTFGTNLYESTGDIYLTANALHHKSVDTTRQHYVRKNREMTRDAVTRLQMFDNND
ncbi:MAG: tyrosine-type recombinase/integrase [Erysipelotrichaceae bacterium]|nr:tyrosine-type recombinase/integrase [Erysipelotrichaceae bacterium]